jgi:hypothetical protein
VMPDNRPSPQKIPTTGTPGQRRVKSKTGDWKCQPEFRLLLEEVRDLIARKIRDH